MIDLATLRTEADRLGLELVPKGCMDLRLFSIVTGIPVRTLKDHLSSYDHLRIRSAERRIRFSTFKVKQAIMEGSLCRS